MTNSYHFSSILSLEYNRLPLYNPEKKFPSTLTHNDLKIFKQCDVATHVYCFSDVRTQMRVKSITLMINYVQLPFY